MPCNPQSSVYNARSWRRVYSSGVSRHAMVYTGILPATIPVLLLGSAVYLGLELTQLKLSHEKYMAEATRRIEGLESEIAALQEKRTKEHRINLSTSASSMASPSRWWWK